VQKSKCKIAKLQTTFEGFAPIPKLLQTATVPVSMTAAHLWPVL